MSDEIKTNSSDNSVEVESSSEEVSKITVNSISTTSTTYSPEWTTDGLKVPMLISINGSNNPFFLLILREEVVKMFKDINEELSHT